MKATAVDARVLFCPSPILKDSLYDLKCLVPLFVKLSSSHSYKTIEKIFVPPPFTISSSDSDGISIELPKRINDLLQYLAFTRKQHLLKTLPSREQEEEYINELKLWDAFIPLVIDPLLKADSTEILVDRTNMTLTIDNLKEGLNKKMEYIQHDYYETQGINYLLCPAIVKPDIKRTAGVLLKRCGLFVFSPIWTVHSVFIPNSIHKITMNSLNAYVETGKVFDRPKFDHSTYLFKFGRNIVNILQRSPWLKEFLQCRHDFEKSTMDSICTVEVENDISDLYSENYHWWLGIKEIDFQMKYQLCLGGEHIGTIPAETIPVEREYLTAEWKGSDKTIGEMKLSCNGNDREYSVTSAYQRIFYLSSNKTALWPSLQVLQLRISSLKDYRKILLYSQKAADYSSETTYSSPTLLTETNKDIIIDFTACNYDMDIYDYLQQDDSLSHPPPFRYFLPDVEDTQVTMEIINLFRVLRDYFNKLHWDYPNSYDDVIKRSTLLQKILEKEQGRKK